MDKKQKEMIFERIKEYCPRNFVTRKEIQKITGGFLSKGVLTQLDCQGIGIKHRTIGNKVVYDINDVVEWLKSSTQLLNF